MSRTPQGAPGSILWIHKVQRGRIKHVGHVMVDARDNTYLALWNGNMLGRYEDVVDAMDRVQLAGDTC